ncbi:hypothetical protein M5F54_19560, partial [Salmonella enterica]|nr:hypothetical protein [Salmonella enterica]
MVTKSKIHCRRISGKLLFQHPDRLFRQISAISKLSAKWHLNRSQFGIRIDHDLASISDHS